MQIDLVRNQIGAVVNGFLSQKLISPTEMRYILNSIVGEIAELELSQVYSSQTKEIGEDK